MRASVSILLVGVNVVVNGGGRVLGLQLNHLLWFDADKALEPPLVNLLHVDATQVDLREEPFALLTLVNLIKVIFGVVES